MTNDCIQERAVPVREDPPGLRQLAARVPGVQQEVHIQAEAHYAHQVCKVAMWHNTYPEQLYTFCYSSFVL